MGFCSISLVYACILTCGSMSFGAIIAYGSATLRIIKDTFGPLSTFYVGAFQAAPAFMAIFSPILWNFLMKRKSLKICTSMVGISGMIFWLLLLTMNKRYFWLSIIIRCLLGITLAGCSAICPLYFSEIAPPERKGFYGVIHVIFIVMGHVVTNLLGVTHKWQPPIYTVSAFMLIFGTCVFIIPDNRSKQNDSKNEILNQDDQIELKNLNSNEIEKNNSNEDQNAPKPKNMSLFDKSILKHTIVSMSLLFLMQLCGIGSIMQNLAPLMSEVGLQIEAGYQATIAICAQLISSFFSSILIDKYGCKILWNVSSAGCALSLLMYGLNVKFNWSHWLPMIFLFLFQFFFGIGMGSVPWIVPSHVFPPELKSKAMSLGTSMTWLSASIVMFLFPYLQKWFGQFGLMMILTGINVFSFLVGVFFVEDYRDRPDSKVTESKDDIKQALINGDQSEIDENTNSNL